MSCKYLVLLSAVSQAWFAKSIDYRCSALDICIFIRDVVELAFECLSGSILSLSMYFSHTCCYTEHLVEVVLAKTLVFWMRRIDTFELGGKVIQNIRQWCRRETGKCELVDNMIDDWDGICLVCRFRA